MGCEYGGRRENAQRSHSFSPSTIRRNLACRPKHPLRAFNLDNKQSDPRKPDRPSHPKPRTRRICPRSKDYTPPESRKSAKVSSIEMGMSQRRTWFACLWHSFDKDARLEQQATVRRFNAVRQCTKVYFTPNNSERSQHDSAPHCDIGNDFYMNSSSTLKCFTLAPSIFKTVRVYTKRNATSLR